jgi:serine/threonine protein kinase
MGNKLIFCCKGQDEYKLDDEGAASQTSDSTKISSKSFTTLRLLSKGQNGTVFLVKKKDSGQLYAMKVFKKREIDQKYQRIRIMTERKILLNNKSPFIVSLKYSFQDFNRIYIVMEFVQGGELFSHWGRLRRFSEEQAKFYMAEVILGLEALHANGIIYRALRPDHVMMDRDGHIKLTDFGLGKTGLEDADAKAYTISGSDEYIAPEILKNQGYNRAVDFWSLGVFFSEMISGTSAFETPDEPCSKAILSRKPMLQPFFSPEACDLIRKLLSEDVISN